MIAHIPPSRYLRIGAAVFLALYWLLFWAGLTDPAFNRLLTETSIRYGLVAGHHTRIETRGCVWDGALSRCSQR